ncbi:hypothetical protein FD725_27230 [Nostoc sp. TCL26-01]|nr:hypothetical protein FD725_27230 [Nostoc sp. TCL26-01]
MQGSRGQENNSFSRSFTPFYLASIFWLMALNSFHNTAFSQSPSPTTSLPNQGGVKFICPEQNLELLTTRLLRDLPSYSNRASQRARRLRRSSDIYSYMLVAGKPEFQPLPLNLDSSEIERQKSAGSEVQQVFFTTLARQYLDGKVLELQEFHWLLLTKTQRGWDLVMMFTQTGAYPQKQPPSPPRDSSNGIVAQGIKTWLRDCQTGNVR